MPSYSEPPSGEQFDEMISQLNAVHREPRASAIIWHSGIEYPLDWVFRKFANKPNLLIGWSFKNKLVVLEAFALLPKTTVAKLYAMSQIRNLYAHEMKIETQEFDAKVRSIIKDLKEWYDEGSLFYEQSDTNLLFTTLANSTYHEVYKLYYKA